MTIRTALDVPISSTRGFGRYRPYLVICVVSIGWGCVRDGIGGESCCECGRGELDSYPDGCGSLTSLRSLTSPRSLTLCWWAQPSHRRSGSRIGSCRRSWTGWSTARITGTRAKPITNAQRRFRRHFGHRGTNEHGSRQAGRGSPRRTVPARGVGPADPGTPPLQNKGAPAHQSDPGDRQKRIPPPWLGDLVCN